MKSFFRKFRDKISFKEPPPPYSENGGDDSARANQLPDPIGIPAYEALDLLANCRMRADVDESEVEYAEIEDTMGLWHSTPLAHRHKSKISLTWVLKENLENKSADKLPERTKSEVDRYRRHKPVYNENDRYYRKCKSREARETRVVGRNEFYHNMRFRSACEEVNQETFSDTSGATEEVRRRHRHKHRRRKKPIPRFGYDIRDLDSFLTEASIDQPGNIPVVIAYPTTLHQTQRELHRELSLALGTVVNAVFKNKQWLYAQTPHGDEGYVLYSACLPLGILPAKPEKKTPCWESSTDIYPRPCGNLTDTEKEHLRGRTRSECRYRTRSEKRNKQKHCAEKDFDSLYLKTKSVCSNLDKYEKESFKSLRVKRQTLLVVNSDFTGSASNRTMSVQQGDVVVLLQGSGFNETVNAEWFYVKKGDGSQGFIPAAIAGHGYI